MKTENDVVAYVIQTTGPSGGMYSFIHMSTGLKIDLFPLKHHDPLEVAAFARRVSAPLLENQAGMVSTPQDLLIQNCAGGNWAEVDRLVEQLGPDVFAAWHLIWDAVDPARPGTPKVTN
jgi:hypothetical protein